MFEISLGSVLVIAGLLMTFFFYVATVSYRLGKVEQQVDNNQAAIVESKQVHASKSDIANLESSIARLEGGINKLFDLIREVQGPKPNQP